jgi:4'-phosphopantetheinyl transferase
MNQLQTTKPQTKFSRQLPAKNPVLENGEAHVWLANLDKINAAKLLQILSHDERARAERFRFEQDKKRFIAARGFLRIILGRYLKTSPQQIRFEYKKYGKPSIAGETQLEIKFNLSHSDNLGLYAFTRKQEIGIDLESLKSDFIEEGIVLQCLTPQEKNCFQTLNENERESFFFDCWTRKEAYLKASGDGFLIPPNQIETLLHNSFPPNFVSSINKPPQPTFSFQKLPTIPGYKAALAVEGNYNQRLKYWLFNENCFG